MFDIGFSELLLIAVVALVVIGPERRPGVARNMGRFAGRLQRYVNDIKRDFNREVEFEEIRRLQQQMETTVQSMQESMRVVETTLKEEVERHQTSLPDAADAAPATPATSESTASVATEALPALAKPRVRKKRDAKAVEPTTPTVNTAEPPAPQAAPKTVAPDDDQFRLF